MSLSPESQVPNPQKKQEEACMGGHRDHPDCFIANSGVLLDNRAFSTPRL